MFGVGNPAQFDLLRKMAENGLGGGRASVPILCTDGASLTRNEEASVLASARGRLDLWGGIAQ